jgi:hypothetical protein
MRSCGGRSRSYRSKEWRLVEAGFYWARKVTTYLNPHSFLPSLKETKGPWVLVMVDPLGQRTVLGEGTYGDVPPLFTTTDWEYGPRIEPPKA